MDKIKAQGQWAKLKGKAAAIRHVVPYALHLMVQHGDGSTDDKLATAICELLVRFYYILNSQSMFLTATIKEELPKLGQRLAQYYQILSSNAIRANFQIWKMTPKLHLWLHLTMWQAIVHGNPRYWWTYSDEDLVGLMVEIAETCHPRTVAIIALFKWLQIAFDKE